MKDNLWSKGTVGVLVVLDQYTRRIIRFGVHAGKVEGAVLSRMFNRATRGQLLPKTKPRSTGRVANFRSARRNHEVYFGKQQGGDDRCERIKLNQHVGAA